MTALSLAEIVEEGRYVLAKWAPAEIPLREAMGVPVRVSVLERLLSVAEAVPPLLAYLEEEVLEAKTCEGQDEKTGKPCEWHALLLALDAATRGAS